MQLFPVGKTFDFMGKRPLFIGVSALFVLASLFLILVYPGPKYGTDFQGGTEIEVAFKKPVSGPQIRKAITEAGFSRPGVIHINDSKEPNRYLIRTQDISVISQATKDQVDRALCMGKNLPAAQCPKDHLANEVKFSPGGDKITVRFNTAPDLAWVKKQVSGIHGISLREGKNNPTLQNVRDHKVEIQLKSKGDQMMDALRTRLGSSIVPAQALRVEWIGPKAGAQLRDSAMRSIAISLVFIMLYIAFRFDLRYAPGAIIALIHDAVNTIGVLIILGKQVNLPTVAAILTIVGYSVNDTVVVYDRVRENLGRLRGATFDNIINISLSEMLSRTILTSATTVISLLAFFLRGTGTLKDFSLTLVVGIIFGTYSSIYVALPLTEWLDKLFFARVGKKRKGKKTARSGKKASATA